MTSLYAMGRLLWRPALLVALFPLGLITALSFWEVPSASLALADADAVTRITLWRFTTLVPAMVGLLLSMLMRELQHTLFGWTLPDLPRKLRLGKAVVGTVLAAGIAAASLAFARPDVSAAVFGWSLFSFAAGGVILDPVLSKIESRGLGVLFAALAFRPLYVERAMELQPYAMAALAAVAGILLLKREFGMDLSRKRPFTFTAAVFGSAPASLRHYWTRQTSRDVQWSTDLAEGGLMNWLRAAHHEGYGGGKGDFLTMKLGQLAVTVIIGLIMAAPDMVVYFPWIFMEGRRQLLTRLPYPVHRSQRAKLFLLSNLLDSLTAAALGLTGLGIMAAAGYRFEGQGAGTSSVGLVPMMLSFAAWAPLMHWTNIRGPFDATMTGKDGVKRFAVLMAYVALAMAPGFIFPDFVPPSRAGWVGLVSLAVVTHTLYWLAIRRHFARADLVAARA